VGLKPISVANWLLQCFDAVGWVIWPVKIVPEMTYKVSSGTLSLCSLTHLPVNLHLNYIKGYCYYRSSSVETLCEENKKPTCLTPNPLGKQCPQLDIAVKPIAYELPP